MTRRELLRTAATVSVSCVAACAAGTIKSDRPVGDSLGGGDGEMPDHAPVWQTVPDQVFVIGQPVWLDLRSFCTDADGDELDFALDQPLPAGLTLTGSIISGTPTAEFAPLTFVASADDLT